MSHCPPFHLAFPVDDLERARSFYVGLLGCTVGRSSPHWTDYNLYGHQIVAHLKPEECVSARTSGVDGDQVPVRHFGVVLDWAEWEALGEKLKAADVDFIIEPRVRFKGKAGEQGTFFVKDPAGNALEFKTFKDMNNLFATGEAGDFE